MKKTIAIALVGILTLSVPQNVIASGNDSADDVGGIEDAFEYTVTEELEGNGESADITLEIIEKEGVLLSEIILPDGTKVEPEDTGNTPGFRHTTESGIRNVVTYEAHRNGTVTFRVKYRISVSQTEGTEEQEQEVVYDVSEITEESSAGDTAENIGSGTSQDTTDNTGDGTTPDVSEKTGGGIAKDSEGNKPDSQAQDTEEDKPDSISRRTQPRGSVSGELSLSAGQSIDKEHLIPGQEEYINLTLRCELSAQETEQKLRLSIPEGFEAVKVPGAADIESVSEVNLAGNILEISFDEPSDKMVVFDIQVKQNKELLYRNACSGPASYRFYMERLDGEQVVFTRTLELKTAALPEARYSIDFKPEQTWESVQLPGNRAAYTAAEYKLTVTKGKQTKSDEDFLIQVPKLLKSGQYTLITGITQILVNNVAYKGDELAQHFNISEEEGFWSLVPKTPEIHEAMQNGYTADNVTELTISCREENTQTSMLFAGKRYESSGALAVIAGGRTLYESSLSLDATAYKKEMAFTSHSGLSNSIQWAGTDISGSFTVNVEPSAYNIEHAEVTLELPEELRLTALGEITGMASVHTKAIRTNKNRTITAEEIPALSEDEYVTSIRLCGSLLHQTYLHVNFQAHIQEAYQNGSAIENGCTTQLYIKATAHEAGTPDYEDSIPFTIARKEKDNINLAIDNLETINARIGMKDEQLASICLSGDNSRLDTQVYADAVLTVEGKEGLSLTDYIRFQYSGSSAVRTLVLTYTTNLHPEERRESVPGETRELHFTLEEGEYLTTLTVRCDELDLCRGNGAYQFRVVLMSERIPEQLSLDGTLLKGGRYGMRAVFNAENAEQERDAEGLTAAFVYPIDKEVMSVADMSGEQTDSGAVNVTLGTVSLSRIESMDRVTYEHPVIDFTGTDPELLAMITGFEVSPNTLFSQWYVTTNQREQIILASHERLSLDEGEYVTGLKIVWENFPAFTPTTDYTIKLLGNPNPHSRLTGKYLGDEYTAYDIHVSFGADNRSRYEASGKSTAISGKSGVIITGLSTGAIEISDSSVYQGEEFVVSMSQSYHVTNPAGREFDIREPVFLMEIDSGYVCEAGSAKVNGTNADIQWQKRKLLNGNSILEITAVDYDEIFHTDNVELEIEFTLRACPQTGASKGLQPVRTVWTDFTGTAKFMPREGHAAVRLSNTVTGDTELFEELTSELYKWEPCIEGGQEILEANELGIGALGIQNEKYGYGTYGA